MTPTSSKQLSILLVPGGMRGGSTNVAALRAGRDSTAGQVTAELYEGLADLPAFNPGGDHDPLPRAVAALRERDRER